MLDMVVLVAYLLLRLSRLPVWVSCMPFRLSYFRLRLSRLPLLVSYLPLLAPALVPCTHVGILRPLPLSRLPFRLSRLPTWVSYLPLQVSCPPLRLSCLPLRASSLPLPLLSFAFSPSISSSKNSRAFCAMCARYFIKKRNTIKSYVSFSVNANRKTLNIKCRDTPCGYPARGIPLGVSARGYPARRTG